MNTFLFAFLMLWGADDSRSVVKVNGTLITQADIDFCLSTRQVKPEERAEREPKLIEELIDRQIIREFLSRRKIAPPADELAYQIKLAEDVIKREGEDPAKLLPKMGYTPERMKAELGLPLAWQIYARQTITLPQTKDYFEKHRSELDGTQLRARQIFLKLPANPSDADVAAKVAQLKEIKSQINAGKISFANAAQKFSESPSKEQGGDVGLFGFRGKLPSVVIRAAFELKPDEISEPVKSVFGVHIILVTERIPGDLSLEDVRPQIMEQLSEQLWKETIVRERKSAKIEWTK